MSNRSDNSGGAEGTARRAMKAILGGDDSQFALVLLPEYRSEAQQMRPAVGLLNGCSLDGAHYVTVNEGPPAGFSVSVTFSPACGDNYYYPDHRPITQCLFPTIVQASDGWYVRGAVMCGSD